MIRPDHRVVVRPRLPVAAVEEAQRAADERGVPLADFLGDVVAGQLPETLAELAREKLDRMGQLATEHTAAHVCRDTPQLVAEDQFSKRNAQQPKLLGAPDDFSSRPPSMPSIAGASGRVVASTAHTKPDVNGTPD